MKTKEEAERLRAAIHDVRPIEELAKARLESVRDQLETEEDDLKLRKLQGEAKELRYWLIIGARINAKITAA